jgi:hypothetical protein
MNEVEEMRKALKTVQRMNAIRNLRLTLLAMLATITTVVAWFVFLLAFPKTFAVLGVVALALWFKWEEV